MKRYIHYYLILLRLNFSLLLHHRSDIFNGFIAATGWGALTIVSVLLLTNRVRNILGWTTPELLLLTGAYSVMVGVFHLLFSRSLRNFSNTIDYGLLDSILLKPIDAQFLISTMSIRYMSFVRITIGLLFCWFLINVYQLPVTFMSILFFLVLSICGVLIMYALWYIAATVLIWHPQLSNILEVVNSLNSFSRYPPEMYHELNFFLFLFVLPMTLIVATPVRVLVQQPSGIDVLLLVLCTIFLLVCSRLFWIFALRHYTSASS